MKKDRVLYQGIFFDDSLLEFVPKCLGKKITNPHITFAFKPSPEDIFPEEMIGREVEVTITAFGSDEKASGWLVELPESVKHLYKGSEKIHITTSISALGKPMDTGHIKDELWVAVKPFKVIGRFGVFTNFTNK